MIDQATFGRAREAVLAGAGEVRAGGAHLPHVVAWNLTRRCNLACAHCYIAAGSWHAAADELTTAECRRIADEILELTPSPLFILSGGEPLLRDDLEAIAEHAASRGATVVVGTNGTRLTAARIDALKAAGVQGVAVSIDSLDARYHDRFRHGDGALADTLAAVDRLRERGLDFIVQTTLTRGNRREVSALAAWAAERGAVAYNLYFLVSTGRGEGMRGLGPAENEEVLRELVALEREYRGRMLVRSKCQPQIMRHAIEADPDSPLLNYATRCPCGVHYCRITPEGKVTPCPYLPVVAGDLRRQSFGEVWRESPVFLRLRDATVGSGGAPVGAGEAAVARVPRGGGERPGGETAAGQGWFGAGDGLAAGRATLGGRCGRCEYRKVCGGCRARAYAETGDLLGPDDSCAYDPPGDRPVVEPRRAVTYGAAVEAALEWTDEARARLDRVPGFVRGVVTSRVEAFARERGYDRVTPEVLAEVRSALPVDFSRRKPFFLMGAGGRGDKGAGHTGGDT